MNIHWDRKQLEECSRAGWRVAPTDSRDTALCRVLNKFKMYVDVRDQGISPHLLLDGFWESWVTVAMIRMLQPGMRVVNVGANVGYFTLLFCELVGPGGRVLAVEPQEDIHELLVRNIHVNGYSEWAKTFLGAAGARPGYAEVLLDDVRFKNATMEYVDLGETPKSTDYLVQSLPLDAICAAAWGTEELPDIVFVDAEGTEPEVFAGMSRTKRKPGSKLVLEFSASRYSNALEFAKQLEEEYLLSEISTEASDGSLKPVSPEELAAVKDFTMVVAHRR